MAGPRFAWLGEGNSEDARPSPSKDPVWSLRKPALSCVTKAWSRFSGRSGTAQLCARSKETPAPEGAGEFCSFEEAGGQRWTFVQGAAEADHEQDDRMTRWAYASSGSLASGR